MGFQEEDLAQEAEVARAAELVAGGSSSSTAPASVDVGRCQHLDAALFACASLSMDKKDGGDELALQVEDLDDADDEPPAGPPTEADTPPDAKRRKCAAKRDGPIVYKTMWYKKAQCGAIRESGGCQIASVLCSDVAYGHAIVVLHAMRCCSDQC